MKNHVVEEFGLRIVSATRWGKIRFEFIDTIQNIVPTEEHLQDVEHTPTLGSTKRDSVIIYACVMLMYAVSSDGIK